MEQKIEKAKDRIEVLEKIALYEKEGKFDVDVENDPETITLNPQDVDYLQKKLSSKIMTKYSYFLARKFLNNLIKNKILVIKNIVGLENYKNLKTGAILTCNHFNMLDSFAMQVAYDKSMHKTRKMYKVIREGNYTAFKGFLGLIMKHCNTLPVSSNRKTMEKFIKSTNTLLANGNFVLFYPEQSMWWNYRKPKPLKNGAYNFAVKNNVPVLPMFITMEDSNRIGPDGFNMLEYTIHIGKPIKADANLPLSENVENMKNENFNYWKKVYEDFYNKKLEYTTISK